MDQLKELFEKYHYADQKWHIIIPILIGLCIPGYLFYSSSSVLLQDAAEALGQHQASKDKFEQALQRSQNVDQLKKKKDEIELLAKDLQEITPEKLQIDSILKKVYSTARDNQVKMSSFLPGKAATVAAVEPAAATDGKDVVKSRYSESVIKIIADGNFTRVAKFMDDLLHHKQLFHLRNISINRTGNAALRGNPTELARVVARANIQVKTNFDLVVYTSK